MKQKYCVRDKINYASAFQSEKARKFRINHFREKIKYFKVLKVF